MRFRVQRPARTGSPLGGQKGGAAHLWQGAHRRSATVNIVFVDRVSCSRMEFAPACNGAVDQRESACLLEEGERSWKARST